MAPSSPQAVLSRMLDPVGQCLTAETARRLLDLRADPTVQQRVSELAGRANEGVLSPEERAEYDAYISAATFIGILQAKARALLGAQTAA